MRNLFSIGLLGALFVAASAGDATSVVPAPDPGERQAAVDALLAYARDQRTTGLLVIQDGKVLARANWPVSRDDAAFARLFTHGVGPDGSLREDVASVQKSLVAILIGIALDKRLLDLDRSVTAYLGQGWSAAPADAEAKITVRNLTAMNSGLREDLTLEEPAGTRFRYNTAAYAKTKLVLEKAASMPLDRLTAAWLTGPLGMTQTRWIVRRDRGERMQSPTGLVTTPADITKLGRLVLDRGKAPDGRQVISPAQLAQTFARSPTNPAYGRLWWLNGGDWTVTARGIRRQGQLIPAAPRDTIMALGAQERLLFVVPSRRLIVVRFGSRPPARGLSNQLWIRLNRVLPAG